MVDAIWDRPNDTFALNLTVPEALLFQLWVHKNCIIVK